MRYTLLLIPDPEEGGYTVKVPALPGITTEGDTLEEALANGREAIELWIEVTKERGEPIPDDVTPQVATVEVAA
jgi:antitoxin HicB